MLSNDELMNEIKEKLEFTKSGESLSNNYGDEMLGGKSLNILNLVEELSYNKYTRSELEKVKTYLSNVITYSIILETEYDFKPTCGYCIDIKYHECLSGVGFALYNENYEYVCKVIDESFVRGFEHVDEVHMKNEERVSLPRRGTNKSSGYDFFSACDVIIPARSMVLVFSDVKAYMLDDEELLLFPRSSMAKHGIKLANTIAKIDSDYFGNIKTGGNIGMYLENTSYIDFEIKTGDRVCQGSFYKYLTTDDDNPMSNKRVGGMGSTGK